jgi:Spy/CpxP family protein refolding chaperone
VERGLSQVRSLIDSTIKDPAKAKRAQEIVEAIVAEVRTSTQQSRKFHEQLYDLNAKYDATPEDFLKILDQLNNSRMKAAINILGLRFKMKDMLTAEEWKALSEGLTQARRRYRYGGESGAGENKSG